MNAKHKMTYRALATLLFLAVGSAQAELPAVARIERSAVTAKHTMVAAGHPLAVDAGLNMLARGGSAIDAVIATQMVLNLVEAHGSGIGGGAFVMAYDAKKKNVFAYDGREVAPMGATPELFIGPDGKPMAFREAMVGGRSVGVPGLLRVLEMAHARHGKLPWATLFQPAITLAEKGFALPPQLQRHLANDNTLPNQPASRAYFYLPDGSPKPVGALMKNPEFAAVLKRVAREGSDAFYKGDIARDIVAAVRNHPTNPGSLSEDDLAAYRARAVEPVCGPYRAYKLCGMPPPSSGGVAILQILGALERFDMKAVHPGSVDALHLITEAERLAYADRDRYLGDDRFTDVPMAGLIDRDYNRKRSALISMDRSMGKAAAGVPAGVKTTLADGDTPELPSTSHISVVDRNGNAIAMTTTIESYLGSRVFVHGFLLNNQLTDFSMQPKVNGMAVANAVYPGKRPRSSMSPTLVFDSQQRLHMVVGSPGGSAIIPYVAKVLIATLDWGLDMQSAISLPNFGSRNGPTEIEQGTSYEALTGALQAKGHEVRTAPLTSGLHGIMRTSQGWQGGADPRSGGIAKGQ